MHTKSSKKSKSCWTAAHADYIINFWICLSGDWRGTKRAYGHPSTEAVCLVYMTTQLEAPDEHDVCEWRSSSLMATDQQVHIIQEISWQIWIDLYSFMTDPRDQHES